MAKTKISFGQKSADKITQIVGSWKFIIIQSIILFIWIILNICAWANHWDPYPFIFLNLALSFQAAYTAPILLMTENQQTARDREKSAIDLATDKRSEREIAKIKLQISKLEKEKIDQILKILKK
jgi:uncharacterized membrane protein